jgi:uncharacterized membrane protein
VYAGPSRFSAGAGGGDDAARLTLSPSSAPLAADDAEAVGNGLLLLWLAVVVAHAAEPLLARWREAAASERVASALEAAPWPVGGYFRARRRGEAPLAVVRLQVALRGAAGARALQEALERTAARATTTDTSSPRGQAAVLRETAQALLRALGAQEPLCVAASSGYRVRYGAAAAEETFNELAMAARSKFETETLVNVDARRSTAAAPAAAAAAPASAGSTNNVNELVVVSILAVVDVPFLLGRASSAAELREALTRLAGVQPGALCAVQVLWAPQQEGDTLTAEELAEKFPTLNAL